MTRDRDRRPRFTARSPWAVPLAVLLAAGGLTRPAAAQTPAPADALKTLTGYGAQNLQAAQARLDRQPPAERARHQTCEAMIQQGVQLVLARNQAIQSYEDLHGKGGDETAQVRLLKQMDGLAKEESALEARIQRCLAVEMPTMDTPGPLLPKPASQPSPTRMRPGQVTDPRQKPPLRGSAPAIPAGSVRLYGNGFVRVIPPAGETAKQAAAFQRVAVDLKFQVPGVSTGGLKAGTPERLAQFDSPVLSLVSGLVEPDPKRPGDYLFVIDSVRDRKGNPLKVESVEGRTDKALPLFRQPALGY